MVADRERAHQQRAAARVEDRVRAAELVGHHLARLGGREGLRRE